MEPVVGVYCLQNRKPHKGLIFRAYFNACEDSIFFQIRVLAFEFIGVLSGVWQQKSACKIISI
jgi:hypothetical protein